MKTTAGTSRDLALVALSSALTCSLLLLFGLGPVGSLKVIQAERIEIVDSAGETRAVLGFDEKGGTLDLVSPSGSRARRFGFAANGSSVISVTKPEAEANAESPTSLPDEAGADVRECPTATPEEVALAKRLISLGWEYRMPRPKSDKAAWGNSDGRTTWWPGYWIQQPSGRTSASVPNEADGFAGDNAASTGWRRGGSPGRPSRIQWMCSKSGGIQPR